MAERTSLPTPSNARPGTDAMDPRESLGRTTRLRRLTGRPADMVEGTRWLFLLLTLASLLITWPAPLTTAGGPMLFVALAASLVLAASWTAGYLRRRAPLTTDVVDAVAIAAFALACPGPEATFAFVFPALWFRSLYGTGLRAVVRCSLYAGALAATLPLWQQVPGHPSPANAAVVLGSLPTMYVTVIVGRHLAAMMHAREQATRRDAVQAAAGAKLLGVTDADRIRQIAWEAVPEICATTAGLRMLKVVKVGTRFDVANVAGDFVAVPTVLPATALTELWPDTGPDADRAHRWTGLDAATGVACGWSSVPLPDQADQPHESWLLVGAPAGVSPEVLLSVSGFVTQVALALRSSDAHEQLTAQATSDGLTGLANRTSFHAALVAALGDQRASPTSVLYVDLDDFKDVNDQYGHGRGDDLLREIGLRLGRATRPADLCARLGGDEFAVLVRGAGPAVVTEIAGRIVTALAEPVRLGEVVAGVGASVGVATEVGVGAGPDELIHRADVAMYAAKASGKGRVQEFVPGLLQGTLSRVPAER